MKNLFWSDLQIDTFHYAPKAESKSGNFSRAMAWSDKRKMLIIKCYVLVIFFVYLMELGKAMNHKKEFMLKTYFFSLQKCF